jgi:hypothetical protein
MRRLVLLWFLVSLNATAAQDIEDYVRPQCGEDRYFYKQLDEHLRLGDPSVTAANVAEAKARYQKCFDATPPAMTEEQAQEKRKADDEREFRESIEKLNHPPGAIAPRPPPDTSPLGKLDAQQHSIYLSALVCYCRNPGSRLAACRPVQSVPADRKCSDKTVRQVVRCMRGATRPCDGPAFDAAKYWLRINP